MQGVIMRGRGLFQIYQDLLQRRPYLVQAVQTGALMGAGDIISQTLIEKKTLRTLDGQRAVKFASIGLFIGGPALRVWYGLLNNHIGSKGKTVAVKKVFVDQFVFAPAFLCLLLVIVGASQGKSWPKIQQDLNSTYFDVLKTNYYVWPWVQLLNFYFIPLQHQVLIVQSVALFWNTYLSWKTNKKDI